MTVLQTQEDQTIYILREAYAKLKDMAMLWSIGKDSNALLWMIKKAFLGHIPFPIVQLDTGMELPEVYEFRDFLVKEWDIPLYVQNCPPEEEMDPTLSPGVRAASRKTEGLKELITSKGFKGILVGIRRDEQSIRAKERVFSLRSFDGSWDFKNQHPELWGHFCPDVPFGCHLRIHPLLHWNELDIWNYTKQENLPIVPLYFSREGKRYRSLGEKNITFPIESKASTIDEIIQELIETKHSERSGRSMDHESEDAFEILRSRGYM